MTVLATPKETPVPLTWRCPPTATVSVPPGWVAAETVEALHSSGDALVRVERLPVGPEVDLDELVAAADVPTGLDDFVDEGIHPSTVLGRAEGRSRSVTWSADGRRMRARLSYFTEAGWLVGLTELTPAGDPARAREVAAIVGSVTLAPPFAIAEGEEPLRAGPVDVEAITLAWRSPAAGTSSDEYELTSEEALAAAARLGAAALPGVDRAVVLSLLPAEREAMLATAGRCVEARGLGTDPGLTEAVEIAAAHDVTLLVTAGDDDQTRTWYAVRPDRTTRVRTVGDRLALSVLDTGQLADDLAGLLEGDGAVRIDAVHREGAELVGRDVGWPAGAEPDGEAIRQGLAGLLSGA